jgi:hypothetical protein
LPAAVFAVFEAVGCEDGVDTDETGVVMPGTRVVGEVAEEEEDLEGAVESESRREGRAVSVDLESGIVGKRAQRMVTFRP